MKTAKGSLTISAITPAGQDLTEVGDHDGHPLVDSVQDHDDDEADDRSCDGRGHLRCQVFLDGVGPVGVGGEGGGEHNEHRQPVDDDADHGSDDEQDLKAPGSGSVSLSGSQIGTETGPVPRKMGGRCQMQDTSRGPKREYLPEWDIGDSQTGPGKRRHGVLYYIFYTTVLKLRECQESLC